MTEIVEVLDHTQVADIDKQKNAYNITISLTEPLTLGLVYDKDYRFVMEITNEERLKYCQLPELKGRFFKVIKS